MVDGFKDTTRTQYYKGGGSVKGPKGAAKVSKVMHEFKSGSLKSSSGQKVTNPKQGIAIALSEGRKAAHQPQAKAKGGRVKRAQSSAAEKALLASLLSGGGGGGGPPSQAGPPLGGGAPSPGTCAMPPPPQTPPVPQQPMPQGPPPGGPPQGGPPQGGPPMQQAKGGRVKKCGGGRMARGGAVVDPNARPAGVARREDNRRIRATQALAKGGEVDMAAHEAREQRLLPKSAKLRAIEAAEEKEMDRVEGKCRGGPMKKAGGGLAVQRRPTIDDLNRANRDMGSMSAKDEARTAATVARGNRVQAEEAGEDALIPRRRRGVPAYKDEPLVRP